jgi:RNA polymerase sigma factor (sigma-70 family)
MSSKNISDKAGFDFLFREHATDLYKFLYYKYGAENNPEDLVQEAFIKLWNNRKAVPPEKTRAFLFTVANNQMLNDLARKKTVLKYAQHRPKVYTIESPEYLYEGAEYMDRLQAALESLSEDQRVTFLLNRVEGKKHQEIADILGISRKAVEKRIYTALAIIQEKLEDFK